MSNAPTSREAEDALQADRLEHASVRFEPKDVRFGCLLSIIIVAVCFHALGYFLVWRFYRGEAASQAETKKSAYPLAPATSTTLPPEPRLEQIDRLEGDKKVDAYPRPAAKEKVLNRYGPTAEKGFVHIPIQQAMKAVAGSLSAAKDSSRAAAVHSRGLLDDGESNSGRMYREALP